MKAEALNAAAMAAFGDADRASLVDAMAEEDAVAMLADWRFWARTAQLPPPGDWRIWLLMAGRGFGKTRAGAEWVRGIAEADPDARIALVGATLADVRHVMVEGESGLLAIAPDVCRPRWEPSIGRVRWPNGAEARPFAASEPEALRGPQHSHAWCDEIAKWANGQETWDNLAMGLRLGERPRMMATTTPRPVPLLRSLVERQDVALTGGRTRDNRAHLTAQRLPATAGAAPPASSGSGLSQPDLLHGPTTLALLDPPSLGDDLATAPTLLIAAAGASAGWRKAALTYSLDDGTSWQAIGGTVAPAVMGQATTLLAPGSTAVRDDANSVDILLLSDAMALAGSDSIALSASANLAMLGDELIQFASAEQVGTRLFRLSGLLRGRRGSEWAMAGHAIGDRFVLIDPDALLAWPLPLSAIGRSVRVSASGVGDNGPVEAMLTFQARAMRPPEPVALHGVVMPDGSVSIDWTRRSRAGWNWLDDTDPPLAEEVERYQLVLSRSGGSARSITASTQSATISVADLAAVGGTGPLTISIAQIGTTAASLPAATLTMILGA
ncbi:GTA baseplate fiber-binding domain-containing protein [Sphingomonas oryzagri]